MRKGVTEQVKQPNSSVENHYITYTYDNLNRLTAEQNYDNEQPSSGNGYTAEYVCDLVGNRLQRTITVNGQSPSLTTTYDYNDNTDRLDNEVHVGPVFGMELDGKRYYAYAQAGGGYKYRVAGSYKNIGSMAAYWLGLPSVWAKYIFYAVLILVPLVFFVPVIIRLFRRMGNSDSEDEPAVVKLSLFKRCLCVLLSYMMLLTPGFLESLAEGAIGYEEIDTRHWSEGNTTIDYTYDDNGSVTSKITTVTSTQAEIERVVYEYNFQNRLNKVKVSTDGGSTWDSITEYKYNPDGIRVQKIVDSTIVTNYLIDGYNHTGYAQVLEETTDDGQTVETVTYTIGDDVITQSDGTDIEHLLYDGHGSTRQTADDGEQITDTFSYDAYGVMLGGNPQTPADTNLLYAGEYFDINVQQYYLRSRLYNPLNGIFNSVDSYSGNNYDPISLHKYLYCYANPINATDPSGNIPLITGIIIFAAIATVLVGITVGLIALRGALISSGARGSSVYVDFSKFNLSGIEFANGNEPNKDIVKMKMLKFMNEKFEPAEVEVYELKKQQTWLATPILSFTNESGGIEFGRNMVGGVRPKIHLGNFKVDKFNGKLLNDSQLAYALAYLASHEIGHSYKLEHLEQSNNIMRSRIVLENEGTGPGGEVTVDDVIKGLLRPSIFTQNQIEVIKNVATTGRTN